MTDQEPDDQREVVFDLTDKDKADLENGLHLVVVTITMKLPDDSSAQDVGECLGVLDEYMNDCRIEAAMEMMTYMGLAVYEEKADRHFRTPSELKGGGPDDKFIAKQITYGSPLSIMLYLGAHPIAAEVFKIIIGATLEALAAKLLERTFDNTTKGQRPREKRIQKAAAKLSRLRITSFGKEIFTITRETRTRDRS